MLWPGHLSGGAGCRIALIVTLIPIVRGCTCNAPHEQLLVDMWQVLVHCALGKVVGVVSVRRQVKEGWGAYLPYTGL